MVKNAMLHLTGFNHQHLMPMISENKHIKTDRKLAAFQIIAKEMQDVGVYYRNVEVRNRRLAFSQASMVIMHLVLIFKFSIYGLTLVRNLFNALRSILT